MAEVFAVLATLGASALIVQKIVSFVRRAFDSGAKLATWFWNILALVLGVAYAVGWQINLAPALVALVPATHGSTRLSGTSGQVLTGLAIGAAAGFWYAIFQALEATVHKNTPA